MDHGKKIRVVTQRGTFYLDVDGRPDGAESELPKFLAERESPSGGSILMTPVFRASVRRLFSIGFDGNTSLRWAIMPAPFATSIPVFK